ncbi:helix-turn-helix transcriptional regulator [Gymnodinialimonas ulvae]|uniref:helix-turn-helix transcriptional regulator n=1 Tax=Gymnodinialimonas ulvae TaxID=3126504 RepID=UPI00309C3EFC
MSHENAHPPIANDAAVAELQAQVGDRVRAARATKAMSRRVLSEVSGVSPRYLAQLEAGEGNISIGLLLRVASALDLPIDALVARQMLCPEAQQLARAFSRADATTQEEVRALLAPRTAAKAGRICLIGLRGAGKSTLGAAVARARGLPFIELNRAIEAAGGMPVAEIMALYGAQGYRQLEADALDAIIAEQDRAIIAVGGGIVDEARTFDALLDRFHTIWIKASPEEHMSRVQAQGDTRPMEGNPQAMAQLRLILTGREADYARADAVLDTSGASLETSLADLLALIDQNPFLQPETP